MIVVAVSRLGCSRVATTINTPAAIRAIPHHLNRRAKRPIIVRHHRASHHWLANVVLLRLALLITGRPRFWMLSPTPERPKSPLIDTLHQEQLPGKDP